MKLTKGHELPRRKEMPEIVGSHDGLETAILQEVERMQRHDPSLIPMESGGYGVLAKDANGTVFGVTRISLKQ